MDKNELVPREKFMAVFDEIVYFEKQRAIQEKAIDHIERKLYELLKQSLTEKSCGISGF